MIFKVSEASEARQVDGRWLEKSGKHVSPNFTLKPSTKASSLQLGKTERRNLCDCAVVQKNTKKATNFGFSVFTGR